MEKYLLLRPALVSSQFPKRLTHKLVLARALWAQAQPNVTVTSSSTLALFGG